MAWRSLAHGTRRRQRVETVSALSSPCRRSLARSVHRRRASAAPPRWARVSPPTPSPPWPLRGIPFRQRREGSDPAGASTPRRRSTRICSRPGRRPNQGGPQLAAERRKRCRAAPHHPGAGRRASGGEEGRRHARHGRDGWNGRYHVAPVRGARASPICRPEGTPRPRGGDGCSDDLARDG